LKLFLERLQDSRRYDFLAVQKTLPKNSGKIVYFTRMTQLTANITALTDGTSPTGVNATAEQVIATAEPYGQYTMLGTQYELTTLDAGLKEHVEVMAQNAGESLDILLGKELNASATTQCGGATFSAQATALTSTDTFSVSSIRKAVSTLKKNKAPKWENGNYRAVLNIDAVYGLNKRGPFYRKIVAKSVKLQETLKVIFETICSEIRRAVETFNDYNTAPSFY
jgi:N4-gp56 family major capsid protein